MPNARNRNVDHIRSKDIEFKNDIYSKDNINLRSDKSIDIPDKIENQNLINLRFNCSVTALVIW